VSQATDTPAASPLGPEPLAAHTGNGSPSGLQADELRRRELAAFLRSRRERLAPEAVGLAPGRRRRTPGLRREEVAHLAGVGATWYTWLEQGRDIRASAQVLDAIARTLRFDPHERSHLFTLAGVPDPSRDGAGVTLSQGVKAVLAQLEPYPACVVNARYDLLAFNRAYSAIFDGLSDLPFEDRNCLWLIFTDPAWRRVVVDWDEAVRRMVAQYRAAMAEHVAEPAWKCLVHRLRRASPEFEAVWRRHDVGGPENHVKEIRHPLVGLLRLDYTSFWLDQRLGTRLLSYTPADEQTRARLDAADRSLLAGAA
jgi:hypothetical protein